jgi:hypothetical protein
MYLPEEITQLASEFTIWDKLSILSRDLQEFPDLLLEFLGEVCTLASQDNAKSSN